MAQAASLGLAGLSALTGAKQNGQQASAASNASNAQAALIKRQTAAFDTLMGVVKGADAAGQFDPTKQLDNLSADTSRYESRDAGNTAGSDRIAGFQAGDTPETQALEDVKTKYRGQFQDLSNQIRQSTFGQKLNAYATAAGAGGGLNAGIGAYGQQQQVALSRMQNPGQVFAASAPYFYTPPGQSQTMKLPSASSGLPPGVYPRSY